MLHNSWPNVTPRAAELLSLLWTRPLAEWIQQLPTETAEVTYQTGVAGKTEGHQGSPGWAPEGVARKGPRD